MPVFAQLLSWMLLKGQDFMLKQAASILTFFGNLFQGQDASFLFYESGLRALHRRNCS